MVQKAGERELQSLTQLAIELWKGHTFKELEEEISFLLRQKEAAFFLKYKDGIPVGFAQCQLRHDYVEGTDSTPVGYLEGVYVQKAYQRRGYAKELLQACENWAAKMGCVEFASDCELDNAESLGFHLSAGFAEVNRIICFQKKLR
jgi:aminoglycoside 6'-N-acetyltransferase I